MLNIDFCPMNKGVQRDLFRIFSNCQVKLGFLRHLRIPANLISLIRCHSMLESDCLEDM